MNRMVRIAGLTILLLAGCADNLLVSYSRDENYLTFDHLFTDKAIADVLAKAEKLCGLRKQVAIQTSRACSLTKCATNYQCVDAADAVKYGL
jgi:hypothetical protein